MISVLITISKFKCVLLEKLEWSDEFISIYTKKNNVYTQTCTKLVEINEITMIL